METEYLSLALIEAEHETQAKHRWQTSCAIWILSSLLLQVVCSVVETFFVTSGLGGAPRPLLSLHIGQGGVVVTMLSGNTKFLSTWRRSGLSYNQDEYFSTPECDVLRDLGSWHKASPFYGTWSNLISLPLLGSSQMTITNLTLSQKLSWLLVRKVPVTNEYTHERILQIFAWSNDDIISACW